MTFDESACGITVMAEVSEKQSEDGWISFDASTLTKEAAQVAVAKLGQPVYQTTRQRSRETIAKERRSYSDLILAGLKHRMDVINHL